MTSVVCYCDTCQEGSRQLEGLAGASPVRDAGGGTAYALFRKDRVRFSRGADLLRDIKVSEDSATLRVFAGCCNAPMIMKLGDALHWVPVYRARFRDDLPPLQFRICTKYRPENDAEIPRDVPSSATYPVGLMVKLLAAKIAMMLRPGTTP
jgi:hypothetical protein